MSGVTDRWTRGIAIAAAVVFLFFGISKLALPGVSEAQFVAWHWPAWLVYVIAPSEIVAGALLLAPRARKAGAALGALLMLGALFTHARVPSVGLLPLAPIAALQLAACVTILWRSMDTSPPRAAPT